MIQNLQAPLKPLPYLVVGFALAIFKFGVESAIIYGTGGHFYSPAAFLLPAFSLKQYALTGCPFWVAPFLLIWTLPFFFVALILTVRRCVDACLSPWLAFWILCPLINLVLLVVFCFLPSRYSNGTPQPPVIAAKKTNSVAFRWAVIRVLIVTNVWGLGILLTSIYLFDDYGLAIFFGAPVLMAGYAAWRTRQLTQADILPCLGVAIGSILFALSLLLLLALEGIICIAMAAPILFPSAVLGAFVGFAIATANPPSRSHWLPALLVLPAMSAVELLHDAPIRGITTVIEIDAPPEQVWHAVIQFPEIEQPPSGLFFWGIAYPIRARIEGAGVGAVRYCEFSTGCFVEPITIWDEPNRLGFSVVEQPPPMVELSPYNHVHAPHLTNSLKCSRGEFRLIRLPSNRTRLEGTTWYALDMFPQEYWLLWSDAIIHSIHYRVLDHIRRTVESAASD